MTTDTTNLAETGRCPSNGNGVSGAWDKVFTISWVETGGPAVIEPKKFGFGQTVMKSLAAAAVNGSAKIHYEATVIVWQLKAALSNVGDPSENTP